MCIAVEGIGGGLRMFGAGVAVGSGRVCERFLVWLLLWLLCIAAWAAACEAVSPLITGALDAVVLERVGSKKPCECWRGRWPGTQLVVDACGSIAGESARRRLDCSLLSGRGSGREKLWTLVELAFGWPYSERFGMKGDDLVTAVVVRDESLDSLETDWVLGLVVVVLLLLPPPPSEGNVMGESSGLLGDEGLICVTAGVSVMQGRWS
jgi:hypothetical protein